MQRGQTRQPVRNVLRQAEHRKELGPFSPSGTCGDLGVLLTMDLKMDGKEAALPGQ